MKKYFLVILLLVSAMNLFGKDFRNITSYALHYYSYGEFSHKADETLLYKLNKDTSLLISYSLDQRKAWANNTITLGAVKVFDSNRYVESAYSLGIDSGLKLSHSLGFDFSNELADYMTDLGYKYTLQTEKYIHSLQCGFAWYKSHPFQVWTKTYLTLDSDIQFSAAEWIDLRYQLNDHLMLSGGGTIGIPDSDILNPDYNSDPFFWSLIAGCKLTFTGFSLKYDFQYLSRDSYTDMVNTITVDVRF